jgi:glycosyltransferase involved in cell wall biosynthesis
MTRPQELVTTETWNGDETDVPRGALDGLTIMRYAHNMRDRESGGVEQYLRILNFELLKRHRMTVLQTHTTTDESDAAIEVEEVGLGRILWIPVSIREVECTVASLPERISFVYRQMRRLRQQNERGAWHSMVSSSRDLFRHRGGHLRHRTVVLSDRLPELLRAQKIDLLLLHWLSYDSDSLISSASKATVPFAYINHFDNARLSLPETRRCIANAAAIGVVSMQGVPEDLVSRCVNLSDAIDTDYFDPDQVAGLHSAEYPIVLLPARIGPGKGHHDALEAARILIGRGTKFTLCFVGAVDSEKLHQELREAAAAPEMEGRIVFPGEKSADEMRNLYAQSSVVLLPSYSEGLGRVLLEAQAMKKAVVAYDCGGISEAFLPDQTGFLVKKGSIEALTDRISYLLQNDAAQLSMGEIGRGFVCRNFSVAALISRHERFYLNAIRGASVNSSGSRR